MCLNFVVVVVVVLGICYWPGKQYGEKVKSIWGIKQRRLGKHNTNSSVLQLLSTSIEHVGFLCMCTSLSKNQAFTIYSWLKILAHLVPIVLG